MSLVPYSKRYKLTAKGIAKAAALMAGKYAVNFAKEAAGKVGKRLHNRAVNAVVKYVAPKRKTGLSYRVISNKRRRVGSKQKSRAKATRNLAIKLNNSVQPRGRHVRISHSTEAFQSRSIQQAIDEEGFGRPFETNHLYVAAAAARCFNGKGSEISPNVLTDNFPANCQINCVVNHMKCTIYNYTNFDWDVVVCKYKCVESTDSTFYQCLARGYNNLDYGVGGTIAAQGAEDLFATPKDVGKVDNYIYQLSYVKIRAGGQRTFMLKGKTGQFQMTEFTKAGSTLASPQYYQHAKDWSEGYTWWVRPPPMFAVNEVTKTLTVDIGRPVSIGANYGCNSILIETVRHYVCTAPDQTSEAEKNNTKRVDYYTPIAIGSSFGRVNSKGFTDSDAQFAFVV